MKRVYIAHPLRGLNQLHGHSQIDKNMLEENRKAAAEICKQVFDEESHELVPVSPLHMFSYLDDVDDDHVLACCLELLHSCDEMWVFGKWQESEGVMKEMCYAAEQHIPLKIFQGRYIDDDDSIDIKDSANLADFMAFCIYGTSTELDMAKNSVKNELEKVQSRRCDRVG